jgi:signal transduction histidine kinase/CheY-like chemotaxis protein/HPt (histidine-containing phosphotransfer) domain-containing protein
VLQLLFDNMPNSIAYWYIENPDAEDLVDEAQVIDCNHQMVELFGFRDKDECLRNYKRLSPEYQPNGEKTRDATARIIKETLQYGIVDYEWVHRTLDGTLIPCAKTMVHVKSSKKTMIANFLTDMREVKAAMDKLKEADERTNMVLDAMPLCASLCNRDFHLVLCNEEAARLFDMPDKETYLANFFNINPERQPDGSLSTEGAKERLQLAFDTGYCRFLWMHQKLDGEKIPCEITLIRVAFKDDYLVAGYTRDLREREAMQRVAAAEENNKIKNKFLANMSHEIRTPMNAIIGITEIQLQNETLEPDIRDALSRIYSSSNLLLNIVNDILDFSKIEAGKFELNINNYQTASLINDSVQMNVMQYENKPIDFYLNVDDTIPAVLTGDELRIKQIINNLLSNAFKYTNIGTVNFTVNHEPDRDSENKVYLIFEVRDTGQGMTREQLNRLFNEFERFNMEANRLTIGVGLGMSITYNLVKMMNGTISVESKVGEGSVFIVRLPQIRTNKNILGKDIKENLENFRFNDSLTFYRSSQVMREPMPYGRVLIVDDMESNLYVGKGLLALYEMQVDTALSGYEAIKKALAESYDIIFMDHMMPHMDGIEATKILRERGYTKPIVALTANAVEGQAEIFMQNGFDGFISKPVDTRQLNQTLNKYVRDKQPPEVVAMARRKRGKNTVKIFEPVSISPAFASAFKRDAEKTLNVLEDIYARRNACTAEDLQNFIIHTHAIKSALANINEPALSKCAARMEEWGRIGNYGGIFSECPGFISDLRACMEKYESPSGERQTAAATDERVSDEALRQWMILRDACYAYEKKTAKNAVAQLMEITKGAHLTDVLNTISKHLLHSSFDKAGEAAQQVIGGA